MSGGAAEFRQSAAVLVVVAMTLVVSIGESKCKFEAIFNFGDSNTDTGGFWAAFPAQNPPNGMTFFKKPAGRATDGRVIVDFLAQALGLPFLSPYLQTIGSDYRHGVNFATLASTVLLPKTSLFVSGISPFSLGIQLNQMTHFKSAVDQLSSSKAGPTNLPPPDIFGKSLYTFYIGQNDFTSNLASIGISGVQKYLPDVVNQISFTIKELYGVGGRTFMVLNLAPIGCYPAFLVELPHDVTTDLDEFGCMIPYNNAVKKYNKMLKNSLFRLRQQISNANIIYVDIHTVMLHLFRHPTSHGLKYGTTACCGDGGAYNFNPQVFCGNTKIINGAKVTAEACGDPYNYVSWDGIHATEAANKIVTNAILNGSCFDPPFNLHQFCDIQHIG